MFESEQERAICAAPLDRHNQRPGFDKLYLTSAGYVKGGAADDPRPDWPGTKWGVGAFECSGDFLPSHKCANYKGLSPEELTALGECGALIRQHLSGLPKAVTAKMPATRAECIAALSELLEYADEDGAMSCAEIMDEDALPEDGLMAPRVKAAYDGARQVLAREQSS